MPVQVCTLPYSRAIPLLPLWAVRPVQSLSACTRVHFTFYFTELLAVCGRALTSCLYPSERTQLHPSLPDTRSLHYFSNSTFLLSPSLAKRHRNFSPTVPWLNPTTALIHTTSLHRCVKGGWAWIASYPLSGPLIFRPLPTKPLLPFPHVTPFYPRCNHTECGIHLHLDMPTLLYLCSPC